MVVLEMVVTYFLPGIGGSVLRGPGGGPSPWPGEYVGIGIQLLLGHFEELRCNPDGTSEQALVVGGLVEDYAAAAMALDAIPLPYDWRMSPAVAAAQVVPQITQPCWLVAHSYGGHVALAALAQLKAAGQGDRIKGIVFWGCPLSYEQSNWSAYWALFGKGAFAKLMMLGLQLRNFVRRDAGLGISLRGAVGISLTSLTAPLTRPWRMTDLQEFQSIIGTFDSIGTLLPTDPVYRQESYWVGRGVTAVKQAWLDRGLNLRNQEATWLGTALWLPLDSWALYGTQHSTPAGTGSGGMPLAVFNGDGVVLATERPRDGLAGLTLIPGTHSGMLFDELVLESIRNVIVSASEGPSPKLTPLPDVEGTRQLTFFEDKTQPSGRVMGVFTTDYLDLGQPFIAGPPGPADKPPVVFSPPPPPVLTSPPDP